MKFSKSCVAAYALYLSSVSAAPSNSRRSLTRRGNEMPTRTNPNMPSGSGGMHPPPGGNGNGGFPGGNGNGGKGNGSKGNGGDVYYCTETQEQWNKYHPSSQPYPGNGNSYPRSWGRDGSYSDNENTACTESEGEWTKSHPSTQKWPGMGGKYPRVWGGKKNDGETTCTESEGEWNQDSVHTGHAWPGMNKKYPTVWGKKAWNGGKHNNADSDSESEGESDSYSKNSYVNKGTSKSAPSYVPTWYNECTEAEWKTLYPGFPYCKTCQPMSTAQWSQQCPGQAYPAKKPIVYTKPVDTVPTWFYDCSEADWNKKYPGFPYCANAKDVTQAEWVTLCPGVAWDASKHPKHYVFQVATAPTQTSSISYSASKPAPAKSVTYVQANSGSDTETCSDSEADFHKKYPTITYPGKGKKFHKHRSMGQKSGSSGSDTTCTDSEADFHKKFPTSPYPGKGRKWHKPTGWKSSGGSKSVSHDSDSGSDVNSYKKKHGGSAPPSGWTPRGRGGHGGQGSGSYGNGSGSDSESCSDAESYKKKHGGQSPPSGWKGHGSSGPGHQGPGGPSGSGPHGPGGPSGSGPSGSSGSYGDASHDTSYSDNSKSYGANSNSGSDNSNSYGANSNSGSYSAKDSSTYPTVDSSSHTNAYERLV